MQNLNKRLEGSDEALTPTAASTTPPAIRMKPTEKSPFDSNEVCFSGVGAGLVSLIGCPQPTQCEAFDDTAFPHSGHSIIDIAPPRIRAPVGLAFSGRAFSLPNPPFQGL
jgi:hypothetical protein